MNDEERLNRLERQNRRLKYWTVVMVLAGLALLIMGQALPPKVHDLIRAKKIEVVSEKGKMIVAVGTTKSGGGVIETLDAVGTTLIKITARKNGEGAIVQYNRAGKPSAAWPPK